MMRPAFRLAAMLPGLSLLLAGCASVPHTQPRLAPLAAASVGLGETAGMAVRPDWWTTLGDPQLDALMAEALAANPGLEAALARLRAAEAEIAVERAGLLPRASADASEQIQRFSDKSYIPPPFGGSVRSIGEIRSDLAWTLDFGGRQKALIDRARSSADAAALDVAAGRLTLAASIAQTYIGIARADAQIAIARDFVASREQSLRLVRARIANRLASDFEARAAETLLAQARQAEVRARGDRALTVHALAALVGRGADFYAAVTPPTLRLDTALPMPEALPSDLLGRRPDILAARARIDAARAGRRIAAAAFMPNVDLRAFVGLSAIGLGSLFSGSALTYGAGPAVHLPLFEGGRLRADYAAATAQADVAIADYNETVLRAVREAADGLAAIDTARADAAEQRSIVAGLQDVLRLDHIRVASGLASQLDILASGDRLLAARQAAIDIDAEGARRRVQLLVALGGGFSAPAETSPIAPVTQARP